MTEQRETVRPPAVALSRNRNYRILWASQAISIFGVNASFIAFPLLVLALTGSPAASGLVLGVSAAAELVAGIPAGAFADRWDRKRIMLICEAIQAVTIGTLFVAVWGHWATVPMLLVVAVVLGAAESVFRPAETACLPNIVPDDQVSGAVAGNAARTYLGNLSGTAAGGFLFAVGRAVPFAANLLAHLVSFVALLFLRLPPRPATAPAPIRNLFPEMAAGLKFLWAHRHVRLTALCAVALNLFFSAFYIVVIVLARSRGLPSGEIGVMAAMLGVGGIIGALAAPYLTKVMTPYQSIISVFLALTVLTPIAVLVHSGYLMGALFAAMSVLPPTANTAIITEQLVCTPDALRGRLSGVLGVLAGVAAAAGPPLGGALAQAVSGTTAVLICSAGIAVVTVLVAVSPTLRHFPTTTTDTTKGSIDG